MTNTHRVTWTIDVDADTIYDAARQALRIQRDHGSIATVFEVDGIEVDLETDAPARVEFYGYRWFSRTRGHTYHSVVVFVDGEEVFRSPGLTYGYGDQWKFTAFNAYLEAVGETFDGVPWRYFSERPEIEFIDNVTDVATQREALAMAPFDA